jgi:hypothetical protein
MNSYLFYLNIYRQTDRQTDRQIHTHTHTHPPIRMQIGEIFNALFDSSHFTIFALFTLIVKDKFIFIYLNIYKYGHECLPNAYYTNTEYNEGKIC